MNRSTTLLLSLLALGVVPGTGCTPWTHVATDVAGETLEERIRAIELRLGEIDDLNLGSVGTLGDDVGTLGDDVGTLRDDVGTLQDDVGNLGNRLDNLDDDVGSIAVGAAAAGFCKAAAIQGGYDNATTDAVWVLPGESGVSACASAGTGWACAETNLFLLDFGTVTPDLETNATSCAAIVPAVTGNGRGYVACCNR